MAKSGSGGAARSNLPPKLQRLLAARSTSKFRRRRSRAPQLLGASATSTASSSSSEANGRVDLIETELVSQDNVDDARLKDIALGHHGNIMPRHRKLLTAIGTLIAHMPNIERNDDRSDFLERATASFVIYMEWVEPDECVYTWIGDRQRMFKLELHSVFESNSEPFICKHSLLSFSCGFEDGEHWNNLKHVLEEVLGIEQSSLQNEIKLTKVAHSFSMKLVEVNSGQSCFSIFDSKKLISEECPLLNLEHMSAFAPTSGSLIKHTLDHSHIPNVLLLPYHRDQSRLNGFNSDLTEFLQRYPATYEDVVPGSNSETKYRDITDPFRVFSRSLILIVGAVIKHKLCIRRLGIEKILVKRAVARLHGVELVAYTEERALRMFRRIGRILKWCMPEGIPKDVKFVLGLLEDKPLETYDLIAHSPVWIPAWDRCHYLEDTYSVFKSDLPLESRIDFAITRSQPLLKNWRGKMEQNTLLDDVVKHNQRMPKGYADKTEEEQEKDRKHVKKRKINALKKDISEQNITASDDSLCSLLTCQEFFASCRHSVVHLPEAAVKLGLLPMPPEMKNFIISSEFAAVYPLIQEGLCQVTSKTPEQLGLTKYFKTDVTSDVL